MIVFDTNVVSELMLPRPGPIVLDWAARQPVHTLFLSSVSEAELRYGIEILPLGQRRERLLAALERILRDGFDGRVLPFDRAAAQVYATIAAARRAIGRPINHADCQIAAIAHSRGASVATRDATDFEGCGIEVINPWLQG